MINSFKMKIQQEILLQNEFFNENKSSKNKQQTSKDHK